MPALEFSDQIWLRNEPTNHSMQMLLTTKRTVTLFLTSVHDCFSTKSVNKGTSVCTFACHLEDFVAYFCCYFMKIVSFIHFIHLVVFHISKTTVYLDKVVLHYKTLFECSVLVPALHMSSLSTLVQDCHIAVLSDAPHPHKTLYIDQTLPMGHTLH